MSVTTLVLGLVVLVLLLGAGGAGIGQVELAVWVAFVVGWVALWRSKRRRPDETEERAGMSVTTLILGLFVLVLLPGIAGFGMGVPELIVWFALMVGWVALWVSKRRRSLR